jgi:hypothetical protein
MSSVIVKIWKNTTTLEKLIVFTLISSLLFLLIKDAFAYDYCYTGGWSSSNTGCSGNGGCTAYGYFTLNIPQKYIYKVYVEGSAYFSHSDTSYFTKSAGFYNRLTNNYNFCYQICSCCDAQGTLGFNNGNCVIPVSNKTVGIATSASYCGGGTLSISISSVSASKICFDHAFVTITVVYGINVVPNANVSYYYYYGGNYYLVDSLRTDDSGSVIIDACVNCVFKINVTHPQFKSLEKVITVTSNQYTISLDREAEGFNSIWENVVWKLEPDGGLVELGENQSVNLTVWSFNNTLMWFSLQLTQNGTQIFFQNVTSTSGGIINASFIASNTTQAKIRIKDATHDEVLIVRIFKPLANVTTTDELTLHGILTMLSNQTISIQGVDNETSTNLFRTLVVGFVILLVIGLTATTGSSFATLGVSGLALITMVVLASYGFIGWGLVILLGFLIIGLSILFSGVMY